MNNDNSLQTEDNPLDIAPEINKFRALQSIHHGNAARLLDSIRSIVVDEDEPSASGCGKRLPPYHYNGSNGLYFEKGKKVEQLSSTPIIPVAKRCSKNKQGEMSLDLMTINYTGQKIVFSVSLGEMARFPDQVIGELAGKGFGITNSQQTKERLSKFIQACMKLKLPTYLVASSMGFVHGETAFLHGDMPIARDISGFDYLVLKEKAHSGICASGTLSEWQDLIAQNVYGWPQIFALSASFASMLLPLAEMDVALFHFYGGSTTGKTVVLQTAASVHGHGGEPGSHPDVTILRWNATPNALEIGCSEVSGLLACVDEMGSYKGRDLSSLLYNMTSGKAKDRLSKTLRRRDGIFWKMFILSSGEMSIAEKLASQNEQLQGGQAHRTISLLIQPEDAAKEGESTDDVRLRADTLKAELGEQYGTAGKAFIECFLSQTNDDGTLMSYSELSRLVKESTEEFYLMLVDDLKADGYSLSAIQKRALKRFALCLLAGCYAVEWNILPFDILDISDAVMSAIKRWLDDGQNQHNPVKTALEAIQLDLIKTRAAHFVPLDDDDSYRPSNHWGYTDKKNQALLIFSPVFEDWCRRHNLKSAKVARVLDLKEYLVHESGGHYKKRGKKGVEGAFYQIKQSFLSCDIAKEF